MSNARAVCFFSDESSKALLKGFLEGDWEKPEWPAELRATSEDGRDFRLSLREDAYIHYNELNEHLQLEAQANGEHKLIVVDLSEDELGRYRVSFFADCAQFRSKLIPERVA